MREVHFFSFADVDPQTIFGIKNYKIYVTGESYSGRYVPYIANEMLDQNDPTYFNVSGKSATVLDTGSEWNDLSNPSCQEFSSMIPA